MPSEKLQVILELVTGQYKREAREAASATGEIGNAASGAIKPVGGLGQAMVSMRGALVAGATAAAGVAIGAFAADSIRAASNLGESINAVNKVFTDASGVIENFGQVSANAVGLSTREFNQLATVTGSMLTNLGFNAQAAARETITLTQRAADMASVFNTDVGTALDAINSGLKGEANPLEQFGVKLSDAAVRARAVELGLAATTAAVDVNAKAVATLDLIYEQTSKTQGDFASTSDDLANAQRRAAAAMENAQARLGKAVTPLLANLVDRLAEGVERVAAAMGDAGAKKSIIFNEAMMDLNKEMAAGTLGTEDLANSLLHLANNADLTFADFQTLAGVVGLSADQFGVFGDSMVAQLTAMGAAPELIDEISAAIHKMDEVSGPAAVATEELAEAEADAAKAAEEHALKVDALAQKIQDYVTSLDAATVEVETSLAEWTSNMAEKLAQEAQFWTDITELYARGQDDLARELEEGGVENAGIARQAVADEAAAWDTEGRIEAAVRFADMRARAMLMTPDQIAALTAQAEAFGITFMQAVQIGMDKVPFTPQFHMWDVGPGPAPGPGPGRGPGPGYMGPTGTMAAGGPVSAGRPYMVGERGPELMVPHQSGSVMPNGWNRPNSTIVIQSPMNDFAQDLQLATILATVNTMVEVQG